MNRVAITRLAWMLSLAAVAGCGAAPPAADWVTVREITPRFLARGATDAALAADAHGRVALTYVTRDSTGKNLWLAISRDTGSTFSAPVRVNPRAGSVASFPEGRPIAVLGPGGALAIAWADRRGDGSAGVDLMVRASGDGGVTLAPAAVVNDETTALAEARGGLRWRLLSGWKNDAFHGFPALTFRPDGALFAAWLDERENVGVKGEPSVSALYTAISADGGQTWSRNSKLADQVCPCCRPTALGDSAGRIAVSYRSGARDLRDPALAFSPDGGRTFAYARVISNDQWKLAGCPDQGPALTWNRAAGGTYAWYTEAGQPGVYVMPWRADHGAGGVKRLLADSLFDAASPRLAALGGATLIAVEARPRADTTQTVLAVRALEENGALTPWTFLGVGTSASWLCAAGEHNALTCWTERDGGVSRVRLVRLTRRYPS